MGVAVMDGIVPQVAGIVLKTREHPTGQPAGCGQDQNCHPTSAKSVRHDGLRSAQRQGQALSGLLTGGLCYPWRGKKRSMVNFARTGLCETFIVSLDESSPRLIIMRRLRETFPQAPEDQDGSPQSMAG